MSWPTSHFQSNTVHSPPPWLSETTYRMIYYWVQLLVSKETIAMAPPTHRYSVQLSCVELVPHGPTDLIGSSRLLLSHRSRQIEASTARPSPMRSGIVNQSTFGDNKTTTRDAPQSCSYDDRVHPLSSFLNPILVAHAHLHLFSL